jgi:uncharacterized membrane protein
MKDKDKVKVYSKFLFTALGLIFGYAIGMVFSLIITGNILWAWIGSGIGLVIGAIIDSLKKQEVL